MPMPETTMNEDYSSVFRQNEVRPARQMPAMKPEAEAVAVKKRANLNFRLGVFTSDSRHHPAAGGSVNDIYHELCECEIQAKLSAGVRLAENVRPHCARDCLDHRHHN